MDCGAWGVGFKEAVSPGAQAYLIRSHVIREHLLSFPSLLKLVMKQSRREK